MTKKPECGSMENRAFGRYPIQVGDLVCKRGEVEAVYYRVIRGPGSILRGAVWILPSDPQLSAAEAKPEKVKIDDLELARGSDCFDPTCVKELD